MSLLLACLLLWAAAMILPNLFDSHRSSGDGGGNWNSWYTTDRVIDQ